MRVKAFFGVMRLLYGAWSVKLAAPARPQAGAVFCPRSLIHRRYRVLLAGL